MSLFSLCIFELISTVQDNFATIVTHRSENKLIDWLTRIFEEVNQFNAPFFP